MNIKIEQRLCIKDDVNLILVVIRTALTLLSVLTTELFRISMVTNWNNIDFMLTIVCVYSSRNSCFFVYFPDDILNSLSLVSQCRTLLCSYL